MGDEAERRLHHKLVPKICLGTHYPRSSRPVWPQSQKTKQSFESSAFPSGAWERVQNAVAANEKYRYLPAHSRVGANPRRMVFSVIARGNTNCNR